MTEDEFNELQRQFQDTWTHLDFEYAVKEAVQRIYLWLYEIQQQLERIENVHNSNQAGGCGPAGFRSV